MLKACPVLFAESHLTPNESVLLPYVPKMVHKISLDFRPISS